MADSSTLSVGYAFREKRIKSLFTASLIENGEQEGVSFTKLDPSVPLVNQGNFDILIHKLEGDDWAANLSEYSNTFPETVIIDDYERIHKLDDRLEMLQVVTQLETAKYGVSIQSPRQLSIELGTAPQAIPQIVEESGLKFPFVAKPTFANGSTSAHELALVINSAALAKVEPPVVLQEFVNHGGVLFKLYVLGDKIMVFKRQSLPDIPQKYVNAIPKDLAPISKSTDPESTRLDESKIPSATEAASESESIESLIRAGAGMIGFNRISNVHLSEEDMEGRVVDPPADLMRQLGIELRDRLGVSAFNVDILREDGCKDRYFIVDINYMPGYERLPNFEPMFLSFLKAAAGQKSAQVNKVHQSHGQTQHLSPPYPILARKKWVTVKAAAKLLSSLRQVSKPPS